MWIAFTIVAFSLLNIGLAKIDATLIFNSKIIKHGINGLVYLSILAVPYFVFHNYWLVAVLLFDRLLFFNLFLSYFRGIGWLYIDQDPEAITDKIAKFIFGTKGLLMYVVYGIIFITLSLLVLLNQHPLQ
jgi:hypothetical protein